MKESAESEVYWQVHEGFGQLQAISR